MPIAPASATTTRITNSRFRERNINAGALVFQRLRAAAFDYELLHAPRTNSASIFPMRNFICGFVLVLASAVFAQTAPVADRVAKQNALFDEFYETGLKNSPERATSYGDYRYNALLGQYSLEQIAREHSQNDDFLKRLQAISTDGMSDKDLLSHQVMERQLQ